MTIIKKAWEVRNTHEAHIDSQIIWADTAVEAKKIYISANWGSFKWLRAKRSYQNDKVEFEGGEQYMWAVLKDISDEVTKV